MCIFKLELSCKKIEAKTLEVQKWPTFLSSLSVLSMSVSNHATTLNFPRPKSKPMGENMLVKNGVNILHHSYLERANYNLLFE